ncbi:MAG: Single-stranded-DNA-specific exonuclease RecJ [Candidatus Carbobacillus altaicus]|uniref:Single-stranded-DNA-specific exonuclease RecJ n=1 Tax=Candidatus Carbonibacillus altaicus TaxID=2163959 RepID=A0A2R6Y5A3_9BACL|nr:MAG: Single-stranded-DNA-specific exonuclease RecJ [Candidatus Carbobacillus altaicus]
MQNDTWAGGWYDMPEDVWDRWEAHFLSFMHERSRLIESTKTHEAQGDPFLFRAMPRLVERLQLARDREERVRVAGDYDADGVLSTTLMVSALELFGLTVDYVLPDRFNDGYGLKPEVVHKAHSDGARLIVTVDNGIAAVEAAEVAKRLGVDLIVTDHHLPGPRLPEAYVLLNPHLAEAGYPFPDLSGTSVALKVAQALLAERVPDIFFAYAALSTLADVMPLRGENRTLIKRGIDVLLKTDDPFLRKLLDRFSFFDTYEKHGLIDYDGLQFRLIPLLNAPGRMGRAGWLVEAFLIALRQSLPDHLEHTERHDKAKGLNEAARLKKAWIESAVARLVALNDERKRVTERIFQEAWQKVQADPEARIDIVYAPDWHEGVIGIVASRLMDLRKRPAFVLTRGTHGEIKGSARSTTDFPLDVALEAVKAHLMHYGGHAQAAGFALTEEAWMPFKQALLTFAKQFAKRSSADDPPLASAADVGVGGALDNGSDPNGEAALGYRSRTIQPMMGMRDDGRDGDGDAVGGMSAGDASQEPRSYLYIPLSALTLEQMLNLYELAPFGEGNPKPRFVVPSVMLLSNRQLGGRALEWRVTDGTRDVRLLVFKHIEMWRRVPPLSQLHLLLDVGWSTFRGKLDLTLILQEAVRLRPYTSVIAHSLMLKDVQEERSPLVRRPREGLKWLYQHLYQSGGTLAVSQLLARAHDEKLSTGWIAEWLDVFVDIGLVTWQGHEVRLCPTEEKLDLAESRTYRTLATWAEKLG